jgi:glycosyltransferase involved in cell wall biosynthesis
MEMIDRPVTAYWGGGPNTVNCEVVELLSEEERVKFFGDDVGKRLPDINWTIDETYWAVFLYRAVREISKRIEPGDMIAIWMGSLMQNVVDTFKADHTVIEPAIGYEGIARDTFACFESYAWMHNRYGTYQINDGRAFDTVIPNFIDPSQFHTGKDKGYALFCGRLIMRKGPHVAADIAQRAGLPLVVMGAGSRDWDGTKLTASDGTEIDPVFMYEGIAEPKQRAEVMANARVMILSTLYIEPFGTVHVEAMASGVPVIAPDYGVFTETIRLGQDGYRYRTPAQAALQIDGIERLRGEELAESALERFSMAAVAPRFDEWLWRLGTLRDGSDGWNSPTYWSPVQA